MLMASSFETPMLQVNCLCVHGWPWLEVYNVWRNRTAMAIKRLSNRCAVRHVRMKAYRIVLQCAQPQKQVDI